MPYHEWNGSFNFARLYMAMQYFSQLYCRIAKKRPIVKEKYGTVRYELTYKWLETNQEVDLFCRILKRTIKRFPDMAGEITSDWILEVDHPYWKPFFEGIMWVANQEEYIGG